jgi:hypothetical protein
MVAPNHLEPQISQMIADESDTPSTVICENLRHLRFYVQHRSKSSDPKIAGTVLMEISDSNEVNHLKHRDI